MYEPAVTAVFRAARTAAIASNSLALKTEVTAPKSLGGVASSAALSRLADVTADLAALGALTTTELAAAAVQYSDRFVHGAAQDFDRLQRLRLGKYPSAGEAIDPSPEGPLGRLRSPERFWRHRKSR